MQNSKRPSGLKILFADDERSLQELMNVEVRRMGHEITVCPDGNVAVAALERNDYDCIIVDLDMPGKNGIEVIEFCKQHRPDAEAVVLTGKSSVESAIAALRQGAFDYLTKPCRLVEIDALLKRVAAKRELVRRCEVLEHQLQRAEGKRKLIGDSPVMDSVRNLIAKVAPSNSTVLILGETGTGKELAARAVHEQSTRKDGPFVAVNCGALPENLIESELFGHRKGAFTGADEHRRGLFEVASGGTIFLDEIGELPKSLQAKLLRVLETGDIRRVGDNESIQVDVRVVCATHRNLREMVEAGEFREDLMYRINPFEVMLPSLRERSSDIPALAGHLLERFWTRTPMIEQPFAPATLAALQNHHWPGNVRELANVLEHASILCDNLPVLPEHLPRHFGQQEMTATIRMPSSPITLRELEMQAIYDALERHDGNKPAAANELGVSLKTLYNKLNQAALAEKTA